MSEHFDVVVVGAGIAGISAGYHLQANSPDRSYVILEGRAKLGGTWDLFRYPGIRSDSDMYTLGFSFRPWTGDKAIATGPSILSYVEDTAHEFGIDRHIRFDHRVTHAEWSSADARWTVHVTHGGEARVFTCAFLFMCSGYYNYARGYTPDFAGTADFRGQIFHPQDWFPWTSYAGRRIVVIGSGATAVTMVPKFAGKALHVTMLQRSPTYIVAQPSEDRIAKRLRKVLPARTAWRLTRAKTVLVNQFHYWFMRRFPNKAKAEIAAMARKELGPDFDIATHLSPRYNPWDQRLCLVPDGDLFAALKRGTASIVTGEIDRFTPDGIRLTDGRELPADIVVTATGLEIQMLGGASLTIDGKPFVPAEHTTYKGMMFSDVPNFALTMGYTNASWTLKADLTANYVTRLLNAMRRRGKRQVTPRMAAPAGEAPFLDFTSGYVQRALPSLPKQGTRAPWRVRQNYLRDLLTLRYGRIDDEMEFS